MDKKELMKLKSAVRHVCKPEHTLRITGKWFNCVWDGNNFLWTFPSGETAAVSASQVIEWIGDGSFIDDDYCFDYVE